ncbi:4-amino-4-deoxychorismate lyase [Paenibacillus sp. UNCCL117]|uniref:aminodeoxychorismate lyase n=1 Tax=unclassified Paenibacillus TaxID=185978 RepID=UPI000885A19D|nr:MULTISPECIES: aminodeoxychorismate lyase [unclassified Paenibacillus]SDE54531.1 4-amino-4-deoxychorismate lyase [Paenibacillus sp. cl123]SFW68225.1 4-amino-4-deoxychorismate lyase [Paenibacillus sp. UNCCL117]
MIIDCNGTLIDERQAVVSVYDHGFLYGMGVFETFRTYGGQAYLLDWHLERLLAGCAELGIRYTATRRDLEKRFSGLLEANNLSDAYFRLTVTAGTEALGLPSGDYESPGDLIYIKPLPAYDPAVWPAPKALQRLKLRRNTPEGPVRLKSLHYMNNILAKREMMAYPWAAGAEGLFLDGEGSLCEGMVSNLFFVEDGRLYTPSVDTGLLPGITRRKVLELAAGLGVETAEGRYSWERLVRVEEVFVTNSVQEVVPVARLFDLNGEAYAVGSTGTGEAGELTRRLQHLYREETNRLFRKKGGRGNE